LSAIHERAIYGPWGWPLRSARGQQASGPLGGASGPLALQTLALCLIAALSRWPKNPAAAQPHITSANHPPPGRSLAAALLRARRRPAENAGASAGVTSGINWGQPHRS
jgi:hypothetical protein